MTNQSPKHLSNACPQCKQEAQWQYQGRQEYPAKYAMLPKFAMRLSDGIYQWYTEDSFGIDLYNCSSCGTTLPDAPQ